MGVSIGLLVASKVPLGKAFNDLIEPGKRYTPKMMTDYFRNTLKKKVRLNTSSRNQYIAIPRPTHTHTLTEV